MFHWKQDYHNRTTWRPREVIHNFKTFSYRKIYFKIDFNYLKSITILKIYFNCGPLVFYGCFPLKIFPFSWLLLYYISYFTMLPWYKYFPVPVDHLGSIDQLWKQKHRVFIHSCNIHLCSLMLLRKSPSTFSPVLLHKVKFKKTKFLGLSNTRNSHVEQLKSIC